MNGINDPMAMWHWVNQMNNGCGKVEDFPGRRLGHQIGNTSFYCANISEHEKDLIDQNLVKLRLYGIELGLNMTTPGCWDLSKVTVVLRSVLAQDAKIRQVNGGQYGFRDFFPMVTVRMSAVVTNEGAAITPGENWASHRSITIWNNGYSYWPLDTGNAGCVQSQPTADCVNIFSPELLTHEFGHALSNEIWWSTDTPLATTFRTEISGIDENYVILNGEDLSMWMPFSSGSQNAEFARNRGRLYGNRLEQFKRQATGEIGAEAYAVWVYGAYNESIRGLPGVTIDEQEQFWNEFFSQPNTR